MRNKNNICNIDENVRFTPKQASEFLGCSEYKVRQMVREGDIPSYRIGVKIMFSKATLEKWIANQEKEGMGV